VERVRGEERGWRRAHAVGERLGLPELLYREESMPEMLGQRRAPVVFQRQRTRTGDRR
jgi:hypothetical protein